MKSDRILSKAEKICRVVLIIRKLSGGAVKAIKPQASQAILSRRDQLIIDQTKSAQAKRISRVMPVMSRIFFHGHIRLIHSQSQTRVCRRDLRNLPKPYHGLKREVPSLVGSV